MTPEGYEKTMPETTTHTTALLNTLWKFTRDVVEDKDSFIQKHLKCARPLK